MPTEAGKGEHHVYRIQSASTDQNPLKANEDYLGVDAVAWFINKQSSWFTDRMASGTLDIKIQGGVEEYQAAMGTFELKGGSKFAPIFDRPMLPDRNFRGGPITFGCSLTAIKKDTVVAGLLKSAATASLGVAAGMVQTATAAGPLQLLGAAGGELIKGVKTVLNETGDKREPLFDFVSGLEVTLTPEKITGQESFLLFHRGAKLDENTLSVHANGELILPFTGGALLDDGAWLLLRLRRSVTYSGQREWFDSARKLRANIQNLVFDFQNKVITKTDAIARLLPTTSGSQTLFDEYNRLRSIIQNDGVLTEKEAGLFAGQLGLAITVAKKSIEQEQPLLLRLTLDETRKALVSGTPLPQEAATIYAQEREAIACFRRTACGVATQKSELLLSEPQVVVKNVKGTKQETVPANVNGVSAMAAAIEESFRFEEAGVV